MNSYLFYGLLATALLSGYPFLRNFYRIGRFYLERWLNSIDETEVIVDGQKFTVSLRKKEPIVRQIRKQKT